MLFTNLIYKKLYIHRYDEQPYLEYIKYTDFENFKYEEYEFINKNKKLRGGFYYYDNYKKDSLIIFCHGLGGGYSSYLSEIQMLARGGYKVLAFDNIGCCKSDGRNIISMAQSLSNLDACINSLLNIYKEEDIRVVGHSWGGYAALNILKYHKNLHAIVDISGFISIKNMIDDFFKGHSNIIKKGIYKYEKQKNPNYYSANALDVLKDTTSKVLIIHDEYDNVVNYNHNAKLLMDLNNPNIKFIITKGKYHNPHYSDDACRYLNETFTSFNNKRIKTLKDKIAFFKDVNWHYMTMQDIKIYESIYETIK